MISQTHDSGSNNDTCARAMKARLTKVAENNFKEFDWDPSTDRVRCAGHKVALIVNAGLQALGTKAPPPPLVKSSILGDFPLPEHTMPSIAEEEEEDDESAKDQPVQKGDVEDSDEEDELEMTHVPGTDAGDRWYGVIDGPFEEPVDIPATNRNEANAVYQLTHQVSQLIYYLSFFLLISCYLA